VAVGCFVYVLVRPPAKASSAQGLGLVASPRLVVRKASRELLLFDGDRFVRRYPIALGLNPVDDKTIEGDRCTPVGEFYVFTKNPESRYTLSLGLSYPNAEDADRGLREGLITAGEHESIHAAIDGRKMPPQHTALGGEIYIHGAGSWPDWTLGCVALDDEAIRALYDIAVIGMPVVIEP
jgi:murein L,D-transpeptidase YafK